PERARDRPHVRLPEPRLAERRPHAEPLAHGDAGPVARFRVVDVDAVRDAREPLAARDLAELLVELGLADGAARGRVLEVAAERDLVRVDDDLPRADLGREAGRVLHLLRGEALRARRHGERARPELAAGEEED